MTKRKSGQTVEAFSISVDLLTQAKRRAATMGMSRSGFYRYCLAKELGYSTEDARRFAEHRALLNLRDGAHYPLAAAVSLNEGANSGSNVPRRADAATALAEALHGIRESRPSSGVDVPSEPISPQEGGSQPHLGRRPVSLGQTQAGLKAGKAGKD